MKMAEIPDYSYILFDDICDIIGPSDEWPLSILKMFWRPNSRHWERFILCTFVAVNGLNHEIFCEWIDVMSLTWDGKALLYDVETSWGNFFISFNADDQSISYISNVSNHTNKLSRWTFSIKTNSFEILRKNLLLS